MDPVQELLDGVEQAQMEGTSRTQAGTSSSPATATRRTKMVFVYSDEDDDGDAQAACHEDSAIALSEDTLAELRADAHAIDAGENNNGSNDDDDDDADKRGGMGGLFFQEDVLSGLGAAASAPGLTAALMGGGPFGSSHGMRVREVDAPALWDGALGSTTDAGEDADGPTAPVMPELLRRGLPAATFVLQSRRKRFRDVEQERKAQAEAAADGSGPTSQATAAATLPAVSAGDLAAPQVTSSGPSAHVAAHQTPAEEIDEDEDADEEEVVEELDVQPVYEEDGQTVRALRTRGGYTLTLDERDLLEGDAVEEEDGDEAGAEEAAVAGEGEEEAEEVNAGGENGADATATLSLDEADDAQANVDDAAGDDFGDFFDDEDEDDEEEEEMDEAIVVAVVEQLVRCCEADDVDPQMSIESTRFVATAKPLLKELTDEKITPKEFGQKIDRDLRRFQRIYRSVYRPRDSPIVIDGVVMDM